MEGSAEGAGLVEAFEFAEYERSFDTSQHPALRDGVGGPRCVLNYSNIEYSIELKV